MENSLMVRGGYSTAVECYIFLLEKKREKKRKNRVEGKILNVKDTSPRGGGAHTKT